MHIPINGLLAVLIFGSVYIVGSAAFAQSTPPLGLPIEEQIDTSVSERIPEEIYKRNEKVNSPDNDKKRQDNSVDPLHPTKPIQDNPDNSIGPNLKYRYP
jgi:hypothetical protein